MDDLATDLSSVSELEIIPPEHFDSQDTTVCLCCCRLRPNFVMDDDDCGICDECLAP